MPLDPAPLRRIHAHPRALALGVLALFLALAIASAVTKSPWWDEGWSASPALNLETRGSMGTSILAPNDWLRGIDRYTYLVPPLYILGLAGWFKLVGFGLLRMRAFSILWALVALGAWTRVVRRLSHRRGTALLTLALLATDYIFVSLATEGRLDMMSVALGSLGYVAYLEWRERSLSRAIAVGALCAAASMLTHPCGVLFTIGLAVIALTYDARRLRFRHLALAAAPYALGALAWGLYALQDPSDFVTQLGGNMSHRVDGHPWHALAQEVNRYVRAYAYGPIWAQHPFNLLARPVRAWPLAVPLVFAASLVASLLVRDLRTDRGHRALAIMALVGAVFLTFFESSKRYYHLVYVTPVYVALLASWTAWLWRHAGRESRKALAAGLACFVAVNLALVAWPIVEDTYHTSYEPMVRFLERHGGGRVLVMGSSELAFGLGFDARLVDDYTLGYHGGDAPQWIVVNPRYRELLRDPNQPEAIRRFMEQRLSEYREVYSVGRYRVFERPVATQRPIETPENVETSAPPRR